MGSGVGSGVGSSLLLLDDELDSDDELDELEDDDELLDDDPQSRSAVVTAFDGLVSMIGSPR